MSENQSLAGLLSLNLNIAMPASVLDLPQVEFPQLQLKTARAQYQQGLLAYFRQLDVPTAIQNMRTAVAAAMISLPQDNQRAYWWVSTGFFDCFDPHDLPTNIPVARLFSRIDQQLRTLQAGQTIESHPELEQMLSFLARCDQHAHGVAAEIVQTYALQPVLPYAEQTRAVTATQPSSATSVSYAEYGSNVLVLPPPNNSTPVTDETELSGIVQIGSISLSAASFKIGSSESAQHLATLQEHFARLQTQLAPQIDYDFMHAAHALAEINRSMGFNAIVELASALAGWLQVRLEHPFRLETSQIELVHSTIASLDRMVQSLCARQFPRAGGDLVYLLNMDKDKRHVEDPVEPDSAAITVAPPIDTTPPDVPVPPVHDEIDYQLLPVLLDEAADLLPKIGATLRTWREQPDNPQSMQIVNRLLHTLKGSARMTGAMQIGQALHEMEDAVLSGQQQTIKADFWDKLEHDCDHIAALLDALHPNSSAVPTIQTSNPDIAPDIPTVATEYTPHGNTLRVQTSTIDHLLSNSREMNHVQTRIENKLHSLKEGLLALTSGIVNLRNPLRAAKPAAELDHLDRHSELIQRVSESVHELQTVQRTLLKDLADTTAAMTAQTRLHQELQQSLLGMRKVPFGSIADSLYRIVRQTGKELNKRADLELSGTTLELDRDVLEKMTAPLEHLLRNALAHGLESERGRKLIGKAEIGKIHLDLQQENNEWVFTLGDDGAGLNLGELRLQAIAKGLLLPSELISDDQLMQLIFASGLSTAAAVSEVSGRGIGMEIVKSGVDALGGHIEVTSHPGKGTSFVIRLPHPSATTES